MSIRMIALASAVGLFGVAGPAPAGAADLGGDCCGDLENRVAALEADTARKGNRKVSLTITGSVSFAVLGASTNINPGTGKTFDVGTGKTDLVQNPVSATVISLAGEGKAMPDVRAGYVLEILPTVNDGVTGITGRDAYVYATTVAGKISLGYQESAGDGANSRQIVILDDVSGLLDFSPIGHALSFSNAAASTTLNLPNLGFQRADSIRWGLTNIGKSGISVGASYAPEGKVLAGSIGWDGKIGTIDIVASGGYEDQNSGALKSMAASGGIREEKSGLFVQGAYEKQMGTNSTMNLTVTTTVGPGLTTVNPGSSFTDLAVWQVQGGVSANWTKLGDTTFAAEYGRVTAANQIGQPNFWGAMARQNLDGAAMDLFAGYRAYTLDNSNGDTVNTMIGGMTIRF